MSVYLRPLTSDDLFVTAAGMYGLSAGGAAATSVLAAGVGPIFSTLGSPACTMPFCMAFSMCYNLGSSSKYTSNPHQSFGFKGYPSQICLWLQSHRSHRR